MNKTGKDIDNVKCN